VIKRKKAKKSGSVRRFYWWGWFRREASPATSHEVTGCLIESLEPRVLLSHALMATPDFVLYNSGMATAADTASPIGLTPSIIRHAYGIDAVKLGSVVGDGTGQTIAIVDAYNDPNIVADLHAFDLQFGLPDPTLTRISQTGSTSLPRTDPSGKGDSWALEISLDAEWAHVVAPQANIVLVEANSASLNDLMTAVNTARRRAGVSVVSMSWGGSESSSELSTYNSYFTTPSGHIPVTFVASSGDSGAYDSTTGAVAADYPAVSANVLAVGGTFLSTDAAGNYISESGWGNYWLSSYYGGSGGGISTVVRQPSYQSGVVTQSSAYRTVPDVAFDADPNSGVAVYDSWDFGSSAPWAQLGGTSVAAPSWAGVIAIADQGRVLQGLSTLDGPSMTLPKIYSLPSRDFHDITTGNNGYPATVGYDLVTGRGTPIVNLLVSDLAGFAPAAQAPAPTIGSLVVNPSSVTAGASVTLTASNVQDTSATISSVRFYLDTNGIAGLQIGSDTLVGKGTQNGSTWSLSISTSGLAIGSHTYYAVATDSANVASDAVGTNLNVTPAAPGNDNFASGTVISGTSLTVTGTNIGATKEAGEPAIASNAGGRSVWYTWTAPANGKVTLNTHGSNFDTLLGVYTGNSVSSTTLVASNDDDPAARYSANPYTSAVTFNAVAGVTYHIAVDGYSAASGNIVLNLVETPAPANNKFAHAVALQGRPVMWTGTNATATREVGEPYVAGNVGGASVWLTWTAPTFGAVTINTHGSNFDTLLGVYTGNSVSGTTLVASNDDDPAGRTLTSAVAFNAVAGVTYHIAVDGYNGATGTIVLNIV